MHIGSTSGYGGRPQVSLVLLSYSAILRAVRASNPKVIIVIAQLIPLAVKSADVRPINNAIPGWAKANSTADSPIIVVDMYTGFDSEAETADGIHPNVAGSQWMADKWFDALSPVIRNH
jgi:lysophospholipase L1-like esterase